ncbi:hypothetical protein [Bacillus cereus group sp. BfR-BA-01331]|uniref:hypothetical protein n=1 Tax=Bacillus cereus group sp. BfR-BA-01331 TaxID=2920307 RepID=UPI001F56D9B1|nr:hypothetical protein [Bacillus cereus group sp. BfR-BA-01331]
MAITLVKVICIKGFATAGENKYMGIGQDNLITPSMGWVCGQTYEMDSRLVPQFKSSGFMIDYDNALKDPRCPAVIYTKPIRVIY